MYPVSFIIILLFIVGLLSAIRIYHVKFGLTSEKLILDTSKQLIISLTDNIAIVNHTEVLKLFVTLISEPRYRIRIFEYIFKYDFYLLL